MESIRVQLKPTPPFDFDLTAGAHTYFRGTYGADLLEGGVYRRLLQVNDRLLLATVHSTGTMERPSLEVEVQGEKVDEAAAASAAEVMAWNLGLHSTLEGFYEAVKGDPVIGRIAAELYGLHLSRTVTVFEALILAILGQQIATTVARIIRTLLIETYGPTMTIDGRTYRAFPDPPTLLRAGVDGLRAMKLSQRKAEYVLGIAEATCDGSLDLEGLRQVSDTEVVERLIRLRGVGHWTAQWLLIRALARPDAFPSGDLALKRVVSRLYLGSRTISDDEVEAFSRRWSPYRSYAVIYMLAAANRGLLPPAP